MGGKPKQSSESKRQERIAALERRKSAESTAAGLTTDLAGVYGRQLAPGGTTTRTTARTVSIFGLK